MRRANVAAAAAVCLMLGIGAARAQATQWEQIPRMALERQFAGPLQDTVIQRWRDPVDGTICYVYLPISVQRSDPTATGFSQYGPNTIGSISCVRENVPASNAAATQRVHTGAVAAQPPRAAPSAPSAATGSVARP